MTTLMRRSDSVRRRRPGRGRGRGTPRASAPPRGVLAAAALAGVAVAPGAGEGGRRSGPCRWRRSDPHRGGCRRAAPAGPRRGRCALPGCGPGPRPRGGRRGPRRDGRGWCRPRRAARRRRRARGRARPGSSRRDQVLAPSPARVTVNGAGVPSSSAGATKGTSLTVKARSRA